MRNRLHIKVTMNIVIDAHHVMSVLYQLKCRWVSQPACLRPGPASFDDSHAAVSSLRPSPSPSPFPWTSTTQLPPGRCTLRSHNSSSRRWAELLSFHTINGILQNSLIMGLFFIYGIFSNQRLLPQFCINYIVCYLLLLNLNKQHRLAENGLTVILFIFSQCSFWIKLYKTIRLCKLSWPFTMGHQGITSVIHSLTHSLTNCY